MLIRRAHLVLVFVLALLQCLAPLIHTHVLGSQGHGLHIHALTADEGATPMAHAGVTQLTSDESAIIGVSTEYKRDIVLLPVLTGLLVALVTLILSRPLPRPVGVVFHRPLQPPHSRPFANAPPALAA